jgi:hypothetical protein
MAENGIYLTIFRESRSYIILSKPVYRFSLRYEVTPTHSHDHIRHSFFTVQIKHINYSPQNPTRINITVDFPSTITVTLNMTEVGKYIF